MIVSFVGVNAVLIVNDNELAILRKLRQYIRELFILLRLGQIGKVSEIVSLLLQ